MPALFVFAALDSAKTKFKEIDVERINVVSPDGKLEMTISNRERLPRPVIDGEEVPTDRNVPGLIFFNDIGDECGGLVFRGKLDDNGNPSSGMHFSMDRFGGDQVLVLGHYEDRGHMRSCLMVNDQPLRKDLKPLLEELQAAKDQEERAAIQEKIIEAGGGGNRLFAGKTVGNSSAVVLSDPRGRARIMMLVTPEGEASLRFLDESGKVAYSIPPLPEQEAK